MEEIFLKSGDIEIQKMSDQKNECTWSYLSLHCYRLWTGLIISHHKHMTSLSITSSCEQWMWALLLGKRQVYMWHYNHLNGGALRHAWCLFFCSNCFKSCIDECLKPCHVMCPLTERQCYTSEVTAKDRHGVFICEQFPLIPHFLNLCFSHHKDHQYSSFR